MVMKMQTNNVLFRIILIALVTFMSLSIASGCTYKFEIGTGDRKNAGTDSTISVTLCSRDRCFLRVPNIAQYGTRGPSSDYFEKGNRDSFNVPGDNTGTAPCQQACRIMVSHDNSGNKPGWFLDFVNVGAYDYAGNRASQNNFQINRWLATSESPYTTDAELNRC